MKKTSPSPSSFGQQVIFQILQVPAGTVATYKQIAELAGKPQGSRGVAWILHACSTAYKLPWHRVLSSQGKISFDPSSSNFKRQRKLWLSEGVSVSANGKLDLAKFQWPKRAPKKRRKAGEPKMFR